MSTFLESFTFLDFCRICPSLRQCNCHKNQLQLLICHNIWIMVLRGRSEPAAQKCKSREISLNSFENNFSVSQCFYRPWVWRVEVYVVDNQNCNWHTHRQTYCHTVWWKFPGNLVHKTKEMDHIPILRSFVASSATKLCPFGTEFYKLGVAGAVTHARFLWSAVNHMGIMN